jgi:hypothetical protein
VNLIINYYCFFFFFLEVKKEYYQTYVDGPLGQNIIKLVNNYVGYRSIMTLDQALKMKCFESCPTYFPTSKVSMFSKIIITTD